MLPDDQINFLPEPMSDDDLDSLERSAAALIEATAVQDFDAAFIIASTCVNPAMLAMFVAEMLTDEDLDEL